MPAFVFNDETITQSMAILEYLEAIFPEVKLLPYEPLQKAKVKIVLKYAAILIIFYIIICEIIFSRFEKSAKSSMLVLNRSKI